MTDATSRYRRKGVMKRLESQRLVQREMKESDSAISRG